MSAQLIIPRGIPATIFLFCGDTPREWKDQLLHYSCMFGDSGIVGMGLLRLWLLFQMRHGAKGGFIKERVLSFQGMALLCY